MITVDLPCLDLPETCHVLDVGCGTGRHLAAAYERDHATIIGADPEISSLAQARTRLLFHERVGARGQGSRCHLTAAALNHLPYRDYGFDLIVCSEVLEHIRDIGKAIGELARLLAPRGHLVVSVPRQWPERLCWFLSRAYRRMPGGHVRIFNPNRLKTMIEAQGLYHWRTHWAHSLHTPFWWLKCLVGVDRDDFLLVRLYHRILVWDIMKKPRLTRGLERLLNPVLGKSVVFYFRNGR
jgi:SAM-dependent methyltransferase